MRRILLAGLGILVGLWLAFLLVHPPIATTLNASPCTIACHRGG
ncbi:MAG: hypothetical protein KatS3mg061_1664 [Dehalococcoidia bacterium]|nr:MAG: hypothetical protein KatS3mg061_1664 [Dehalococcoidia bacterium]